MYTCAVLPSIVVFAATLPAVQAVCNPIKSSCSPIAGFTADYTVDFTQTSSLPAEWIAADGAPVKLGANGAEFAWRKQGDSPYIWTDKYMWYGTAEVVMKVANGTGVISSAVLYADDLDEIDWEWSGNNFAQPGYRVSTNYFGKGITGSYDRATVPKVSFNPVSDFHTYTLDWSPERLIWKIDGTIVRTLLAASTDQNEHQYPQTPSRFHLGLWAAGDPSGYPGTAFWAGGWTDLTKGPYIAYVKSVKIQNMNPGPYYEYMDKSGSQKSVKIVDSPRSTSSKVSSVSPSTPTLNPMDYIPRAGDAPPSPTQSPVAGDCNRWYMHNKTGSCADIASTHGISLSDFLAWNPAVGSECYNLWFNYWTCVGVGEIPESSSITNITTTTDNLHTNSQSTVPVTSSADLSDNAPANGQGNAIPTAYPISDEISTSSSNAPSSKPTYSTIPSSSAVTKSNMPSATTTLLGSKSPFSDSTSSADVSISKTITSASAFVNVTSDISIAPTATASASLSCPGSHGVQYTTDDGSTYLIECSIDRPYGDMQSISTPMFALCIEQCASIGSKCVGAVWGKPSGTAESGTCWIKTNLSPGIANAARWGAKRLSGATTTAVEKPGPTTSSNAATATPISVDAAVCPAAKGQILTASNNPKSSSYVVECGIDRPYSDIRSAATLGLQPCIDLCEASSGCTNVAWRSDTKLCYLKKTVTGSVSNSLVSGATRRDGAATGDSMLPVLSTSVASSATIATTISTSTSADSLPATSTKITSTTSASNNPACPSAANSLYQNVSSSYSYKLECSIDHPGNDILVLSKQNYTSCIAACDSPAKCAGIVWRLSDGMCWLKSSMGWPNPPNTGMWGALRQPIRSTSISSNSAEKSVAEPIATTSRTAGSMQKMRREESTYKTAALGQRGGRWQRVRSISAHHRNRKV